jgi:hypothetical protein
MLESIPIDIIREYIIPYTYRPQSKELCEDVRSYTETRKYLLDMYSKEYENINEDKEWLSNDISRFMNQDQPTMFGFVDFYIQFFKRLYMLRNMSREKIISFFNSSEFYMFPSDINRNIGLMLPFEREDLKMFLYKIIRDNI